MANPLSIKILETLSNLQNMYAYQKEEVLVLEAVANGMDAKAKKIDIRFDTTSDAHHVTFHNDGPPMNKPDFKDYHTISSSTKTKGEGIGFAGVGAKIFLASSNTAEIITITGKDDKILVSKMFRKGDEVLYESSTEGVSIQNIIGNSKLNHQYGTSYRVKLTKNEYSWLKNNIEDKLQFWFNYALTAKNLELTVDRKKIKPWVPTGDKYENILKYKNHNIPYYIWISKDDIPEDRRHIVFSVFGKRIKNESVNFANEIKGDASNKVFCMADVSLLADQLTANKEDFKKNTHTGNVRNLIKKTFYSTLKEKGLINTQEVSKSSTNVIVNELTKRLDKTLQAPDFKFLNPFSNPKIHYVPITDDDGNIVMKEVEGQQKVKGTKGGENRAGSGTSSGGDKPGTGHYEDDEGDKTGKTKQQKSRGISIITEDYPEDNREGWVDMNNRGVVYNSGHPFAKSIRHNDSLFDFNLARVIISSLIKDKNDQIDMDATTTLGYFEKILHQVWL